MIAHRDKAAAKAKKDWTDEVKAEYLKNTDNEALRALQLEAEQREVKRLKTKSANEQLLTDFTGLGVDTTKLAKGAKVVLHLGEPTTLEVVESYRDHYGDTKTRRVEKPGYTSARRLTLVAIGEGRFRVDADSLLENDNPYAQNDAYPLGTIIGIGRQVRLDGQEKVEPYITADVPIHFTDFSTSTPVDRDGQFPAANITVDGVSARTIEHVKEL